MRLIVCARFAHMFSCHVLPRVAHQSFLCQHARRSECHTVFRTSVYLFFASFPLPERVSRHLYMCARAQKPERFFLCCCLFTCIHEPLHLHHQRVLHSGTFSLLARVRKLEKALNLLIESEFMPFRLVFVSQCESACRPFYAHVDTHFLHFKLHSLYQIQVSSAMEFAS